MPRYAYICSDCKHEMEATRKVEERDEEFHCYQEDCKGTMTRTIAQTAPPAFKGSGWTPRHYR